MFVVVLNNETTDYEYKVWNRLSDGTIARHFCDLQKMDFE